MYAKFRDRILGIPLVEHCEYNPKSMLVLEPLDFIMGIPIRLYLVPFHDNT